MKPCEWVGCRKEVKRGQWGCSYHWFRLPQGVRTQINENRPESEKEAPNQQYKEAVRQAAEFSKLH